MFELSFFKLIILLEMSFNIIRTVLFCPNIQIILPNCQYILFKLLFLFELSFYINRTVILFDLNS